MHNTLKGRGCREDDKRGCQEREEGRQEHFEPQKRVEEEEEDEGGRKGRAADLLSCQCCSILWILNLVMSKNCINLQKYVPIHSRGAAPSSGRYSSILAFSSRCILLFPRIDLLDFFQTLYSSKFTTTYFWGRCGKEVPTNSSSIVPVSLYQILIVIVT